MDLNADLSPSLNLILSSKKVGLTIRMLKVLDMLNDLAGLILLEDLAAGSEKNQVIYVLGLGRVSSNDLLRLDKFEPVRGWVKSVISEALVAILIEAVTGKELNGKNPLLWVFLRFPHQRSHVSKIVFL